MAGCVALRMPRDFTRRLGSRASRCALTATLAVVAEAAVCATVQMPGSLTNEDVAHSVGEAAQRWEVEFLASTEADMGDWRFRATERATGETRTFSSGPETGGFFVLARTYESLALIGADGGSGTWVFTVYDIEADRKVVEFWAFFPHLSPDNRYLAYRKWQGRWQSFDPTIKIVDLGRGAGSLEVADVDYFEGVGYLEGIGEVVFPSPAPAGRPELAGAYGRAVTYSWFHRVAWDMDNGMLYFVGTDRAGCLNLVAYRLGERRIACRVPLVSDVLPTEYFEGRQEWQFLTGIALRSSGTVVVTTDTGSSWSGVRSTYEVELREACSTQSPGFVESLEP